VTNQSQRASDAGAVVSLATTSTAVQIAQAQQTIGSLAPGQSTVVTFSAVDQASDGPLNLPLAVSVSLPSGRRVGLLDTTDQVAVQNDYTISVGGVSTLRGPGIARVQYTITNVASRLLYKGLQLKVTVLGANASTFTVLGPNPQYLTPIAQGKSISFVVPVLSNGTNSGSTLQLEVDEDGRTVVVHQLAF
jgi:hypothetical protein